MITIVIRIMSRFNINLFFAVIHCQCESKILFLLFNRIHYRLRNVALVSMTSFGHFKLRFIFTRSRETARWWSKHIVVQILGELYVNTRRIFDVVFGLFYSGICFECGNNESVEYTDLVEREKSFDLRKAPFGIFFCCLEYFSVSETLLRSKVVPASYWPLVSRKVLAKKKKLLSILSKNLIM